MEELKNKRKEIQTVVLENITVIGLLAILLIFQVLTGGKMLTVRNLKSIFDQSFYLMLGCIASTFLFAQGGLDLTMGNAIGFSSLIAARFASKSIGLTLILCIVVAVAISLINGFLYAKMKLPLFIAGLSTSFVLGGFLLPLSNNGKIAIPFKYVSWNSSTLKLVVLLLFFVVYGYLFVYTKIGKQMKVMGAGETAAVQSGVNVAFMKQLAFIFSGIAVGVLAFMVLLRDLGANSNTGNSFEFNVMVAMVLGGMPMNGGAKAKFRYSIYGAITLTTITTGLTMWGVNGNVQSLVKAGIFIVVLAMDALLERRESK